MLGPNEGGPTVIAGPLLSNHEGVIFGCSLVLVGAEIDWELADRDVRGPDLLVVERFGVFPMACFLAEGGIFSPGSCATRRKTLHFGRYRVVSRRCPR